MNQVEKYRFLLRDFLLDHYPLEIHRQYDNGREFSEALSTRTFTAADVPKFRDEPIAMEDSMRNSMWDITILIFFNIAFFMAAYISFLYRDVR